MPLISDPPPIEKKMASPLPGRLKWNSPYLERSFSVFGHFSQDDCSIKPKSYELCCIHLSYIYIKKISGEIWEKDFDPVHVAMRALYKKDLQSAMDRYTE